MLLVYLFILDTAFMLGTPLLCYLFTLDTAFMPGTPLLCYLFTLDTAFMQERKYNRYMPVQCLHSHTGVVNFSMFLVSYIYSLNRQNIDYG
jgi:hypothetical protein